MGRASLLLLAIMLVGCPRRSAGPIDAGPIDAQMRDPTALYRACIGASDCTGVDEECEVIDPPHEPRWCTWTCREESDCPEGHCLIDDSSAGDFDHHCHQRCTTDTDCRAPGLSCVHVEVMSTGGAFETDICLPPR